MTENTPDAVQVAREACAQNARDRGWPETAKAIEAGGQLTIGQEITLTAAILGDRAMQAGMAAPAGVRPSPQIGEEADKYCAERGERWTKAFRALRNYCMGNMADEDGGAYPLVDLLTRPGDPITDGEFELISIVDEVLSAIEDAGAREGAEDQQSSGAGLEDDISPVEAMAIACGMIPPAVNLHDAHAREKDAARYRQAIDRIDGVTPTPAGAGDLVRYRCNALSPRIAAGPPAMEAAENGEWTPYAEAASRIEALEAENAALRIDNGRLQTKAMGAVDVANAAEADLAALRAEVERKDKALREAREDILGFTRARGSEYEGTDEDAVGYIDAALAPAKAGG